jgi:hypothetical protein
MRRLQDVRDSMPAPAPVRRTLRGEGTSLARLISVVVVVTVLLIAFPFVVAKQRLAVFPGPRERWGWSGKTGFAGTRLHGAGVQRRRRKLGGSLFGGEKERSSSAPSTPHRRR